MFFFEFLLSVRCVGSAILVRLRVTFVHFFCLFVCLFCWLCGSFGSLNESVKGKSTIFFLHARTQIKLPPSGQTKTNQHIKQME